MIELSRFVEELARALNSFLEVGEGIEIDDSNFSDLFKKLVKAGFIEKKEKYM